jgi:hypothetical protein
MTGTKHSTGIWGIGILAALLALGSCASPARVCECDACLPSYAIMGQGRMPGITLGMFLSRSNPSFSLLRAEAIAGLYMREAGEEGVNADVAFVQMCLETGYMKFGGTVKPEQNNFCGLGTVSADVPGESFATPREGIRAHIQHLKAYGSTLDLNNPRVDRRFTYVKRGIAPTVFGLSGRWAASGEYGDVLKSMLDRLYAFNKKVCWIQLPHQAGL